MAGPEDESLSLDSRIELPNESEQFDTATYVAALAANPAAGLPRHLPEWLKANIESQAAIVRENLGLNQPGPFDPTSPEAKREREKRDDEITDMQVAILQQQERDRWARTQSTVGGVTMSGQEWDEMAKRLRSDDELRTRVLAAFKRRGMSEAEAEARYERAADIAEIMAIPPSQRTPEQKETVRKADADPTFKQDQKDIQATIAQRPSTDSKSKLSSDFKEAATATANAGNMPSTPMQQPERRVEVVAGLGF